MDVLWLNFYDNLTTFWWFCVNCLKASAKININIEIMSLIRVKTLIMQPIKQTFVNKKSFQCLKVSGSSTMETLSTFTSSPMTKKGEVGVWYEIKWKTPRKRRKNRDCCGLQKIGPDFTVQHIIVDLSCAWCETFFYYFKQINVKIVFALISTILVS